MQTTRHRRLFGMLSLVVATMGVAGPASAALQSIVPHKAEYKIKINVLGGNLHTVVSQTETGFVARSVVEPTGMAKLLANGTIEESSEFITGSNGIQPQVYASSDTLSRKDKSMRFVFDWDEHSVSGTINDEDFFMQLEGEAHDRISIQYELMYNLLNDIPSREYALVDGEKIQLLEITNIGTKMIDVPFGRFEAVGIRHQKKNSSRVTTLWCVKELGYLPALIEQHRKGKLNLRAVLSDYVPTPPDTGTIHASQ